MQADTLWYAYRERGDVKARDQLLYKHLQLVHHVAWQVLRAIRVEAEIDDLVSAGTIGLIKAVESFEPSRGLAFSTFAAPRIQGAILDHLRRTDHASRSVRQKQRRVAEAKKVLTAELGREPGDHEIADRLGIGIEQLWNWQVQIQQSHRISLDGPANDADEQEGTVSSIEALIGDEAQDIEAEINHLQEVERLQDALMELAERERLVLTLYYYKDLKLREIAEVLNVTESRVSQIRSAAIKRLREQMVPPQERAGDYSGSGKVFRRGGARSYPDIDGRALVTG